MLLRTVTGSGVAPLLARGSELGPGTHLRRAPDLRPYGPPRIRLEQQRPATKRALVRGAGGFVGGHPAKKVNRGYWVRSVGIKPHEFAPTQSDEFCSWTCATGRTVGRP